MKDSDCVPLEPEIGAKSDLFSTVTVSRRTEFFALLRVEV